MAVTASTREGRQPGYRRSEAVALIRVVGEKVAQQPSLESRTWATRVQRQDPTWRTARSKGQYEFAWGGLMDQLERPPGRPGKIGARVCGERPGFRASSARLYLHPGSVRTRIGCP